MDIEAIHALMEIYMGTHACTWYRYVSEVHTTFDLDYAAPLKRL